MLNKKHNFAIIHRTNDLEFTNKLGDKLLSITKTIGNSQLFVFHVKGVKMPENNISDITYVELPEDINGKEVPKIMNHVFRYFKVEHVSEGMLYVFDEKVEVVDEKKFITFIPAIENMMDLMGHRLWLNTSCDECNYNFDKFDGRCVFKIDIPEFGKIFGNDIIFASNANFDFSIYDLDSIDISEMLLDEQFTIGMFFILSFLAKRRNSIPGCFMNLYPTVPQELGVMKFREIKEEKEMEMEGGEQEFKRQQMIFNEMKLDTSPTIKVEYAGAFLCNRYLKRLEGIDPEAAHRIISGFNKIEEEESGEEEK